MSEDFTDAELSELARTQAAQRGLAELAADAKRRADEAVAKAAEANAEAAEEDQS